MASATRRAQSGRSAAAPCRALALVATLALLAGCRTSPSARAGADGTSGGPELLYPPPPYADASRFVEREVRLPTDPPTTASLCLPYPDPDAGGGLPPAALLVGGWGATDRDATLGPNKPMRDLAWGLASRGIAVLRFDPPRRLGARERLGPHTLEAAAVAPAHAALRWLLGRSAIDPDRVAAVGHSIGGLVVARLARREPRLRGLVLMAAASRPLERVVVDQLRYVIELDGVTTDRERALLASLTAQAERAATIDEQTALAPSELPLGLPPAFWLDLKRHPLAADLAVEERPVLVLHGERDYQVTAQDFAGWQALLAHAPRASFRRYEALNHLLMPSEGPRAPTEYRARGHVSAEVVGDLADWLGALGP